MTVFHGEARFPVVRMSEAVDAAQLYGGHIVSCKVCLEAAQGERSAKRMRLMCDEGLSLFSSIAISVLVGTAEAMVEARKNATAVEEH